MLKIGILDLAAYPAQTLWDYTSSFPEKKQNVSLTPQVISVWCRQMGYRVYYATYYGIGDPQDKLPGDLDVIFISAHSYLAPLAYALCKVYRMKGTRTVMGGPHAKSFPQDCLRYCDLVVLECDKLLIADILRDQFESRSIISSLKPYDDTPTIEERLPEIRSSTFAKGRPHPYAFIPMLASMGCPYTCDFCIDWNSRYRALPAERLVKDLRYAAQNLPGVRLFFYDPNFGIRFDETMSVFERVPPERRSPYIVESSLSNLRPDRLKRLRDTNCLAMAPGIESWMGYSNKAGVGRAAKNEKLERVVEHLRLIHEYVPYLQANFILGLDCDAGDEPFELTKEFLLQTPFVFPTLNIPMAFGGTPLYDIFLKEGRILKTMPFMFYQVPYLTLILKNYGPITYFRKMVDLYAVLASGKLLRMRLSAKTRRDVKAANFYRTLVAGQNLKVLQRTLRQLETDAHVLAFHAGETDILPDMYANIYKRQLGRYAELMPLEESQPVLSEGPVTPVVASAPVTSPDYSKTLQL